MESDNLLASLSADEEIQAVTWWLACQQDTCRSWRRSWSTSDSQTGSLAPNTKQNNWAEGVGSQYAISQAHPFVYL